jgi:hypothetical protein
MNYKKMKEESVKNIMQMCLELNISEWGIHILPIIL